jgi:prepilin-type N-terminal cleavage/methylation domain-containing protein
MAKSIETRAGFNLIEMLVVIAVIGILAALLFPALSSAKARARRTACLNNLRQINLGIRMYCDDADDATPSRGVAPGSTNHVTLYSGYKALMKSYVGLKGASSPQDRLFACPADHFYPGFVLPNYPDYHYLREPLHAQPVFDYSSYAFNGGDNVPRTFGTTNRFTITPHGLTGLKFSSVRHPDRTVVVAEASALAPWSWHDPSAQVQFSDAKSVVSFVDGHVSYIKIFWNSARYPNGGISLAMDYDPSAGYDYKWSGD